MIRQAVLGVAVLAFACVFAVSGHALAAAPDESVRMLQRAIDARDMDMAAKYLDVDAVTANALDAALADENVQAALQKNPATAVILAFGGSGSGEALRALLAGEIREYVRHGVVSGAFAGKPVAGASEYGGIFGKAFRGGEKDKRTFGPAATKRQKGDDALVATTLVENRKNRTYPLELAMKKQDGTWRIVAVSNVADLVAMHNKAKKK